MENEQVVSVNKPVILITGASSGIGLATARKFALAGFRVILAARRYDRLLEIAKEITDQGGEAYPVETDVSKFDHIERLVQVSLNRYGQIDVLLNNAGCGRLRWLESLDPIDDIEELIRINLIGVLQTTSLVLPSMISRRSGHIINLASIAGLVATPTYTIYAASKFGIRGFSEALRREVKVYGIHVSVIYPGGVDTEFKEHARIQRKTGLGTPKRILLSPEQVSDVIWKVYQRPKRSVVIPSVYRLVVAINAILPGFVDRVLESQFVKKERGIER